jgi:hypothetical protein
MRTLSVTTLLLVVPFSPAAPALGDKPKWEYAELSYRVTPARAAGVDADGKEIPAVPAGVAVRWTTGAGEVEAKSWAELAEKVKASGFKKDGSVAFQKIQILNHLGSEGWEVIAPEATAPTVQMIGGMPPRGGPGGVVGPVGVSASYAPTTWLLKRRLP